VADTLREFIVSLGFKLDESQQRNFVGALEGATLRAKLLGDAIEVMARTVVSKVADVATQFEQLFYQSSRVGASASSIRAFEYAVSQLGGTVESANSSLEGFAKFIRETPGGAAAVAHLPKIPLEDTKDTAKFLLEANDALSRMSPALQAKYRETFSLGDYNTSIAGQNAKAEQLYNEQLKRDKDAGIGADAMKRATEFEQTWRGVWARIGTIGEGGESKLLAALTNPMQKFGDWLDKNSPQINDAISKMATSVGALTTAWVDDLDKVKWPDVAKDFDEIAKSIAHFTDELVRSLPLLQAFLGALLGAKVGGLFGPLGALLGAGAGALAPGMIEQEMDPNAPHAADTGVGGVLSRAWGGVKRFFGGGGAPAGIRARGAGGTPTGNEAALAKQGYDYWRGQGLSHDQALSVLGNQRGENPLGSLNDAGGSGQFQWDARRRAQILAATGIDVHNAGFLDQQKAARWEMENSPDAINRVWNQLKGTKSKEDAVWTMVHGYERSLNQGSDAAIRLGYADRYGKIIPNIGSGSAMAAPAPPQMSPAGGPWVKSGGKEYATDANGMIVESASRPGARLPKAAPLNWDTGPVWDRFNAQLPTGPSGGTDSSKSITSSVTNNITVSGSDPQSTAAMVGVHLDRSSNDISRNLQGAFQ
jgi:hypothetical protein